MFKRNKIEVVAPMGEMAYEEEKAKYKFATHTEVAIATAIPVATSVGFAAHQYSLLNNLTPLAVTATGEWATQQQVTMIPTGFIADKTLETLATIFDPFIQIIVGISFPVASLMVAIGFFIMMFGMKEKALTMIMNAGIGYVLVQMLPLFNQLLRAIGAAV